MSFDITNITKKSNLDENDSISCYSGHCAQQTHLAYQTFFNFIKDATPARILEIGTAQGGFTAFLKTCCNYLNLNTHIRSYDVVEPGWSFQSLRDMGVDVRVENIFNPTFTEVDSEVIEFIQGSGVTIVLCDGGWKIGEFNLLSKYIKSGDFILAHDYAETAEIFQQDIYKKIWNWKEITRNDINLAMLENNLEKYQPHVFENAAWVCTQKK